MTGAVGDGEWVLGERYALESAPLGRGGMGLVYEGRDLRLKRRVAVKFIRFPHDADKAERKEMVDRFVRESRITAELQHPGVPAVFDAGADGGGRPYLVMQRIDGMSIGDLVSEQERLSVGWTAGIGAQVCSVLAAAHGASLVHRDLKPANLMLEKTGTVKVLDFGLAVALDRTDMSRITRTGHTPGTPEYMAPEQLMAGRATPRSDLYALGCVLFEMLTGKRLFRAHTPWAVASKQASETPERVRSVRSDVPSGMSEVIAALLEKRPEDRPEDAVEVHGRLMGFVGELEPIPGALHPPSKPNPQRMYGAALSRVAVAPGPSKAREESRGETAGPDPGPRAGADAWVIDRSAVSGARLKAGDLVSQGRNREAADALRGAAVRAAAAFGATDPEVVELRLERANILFQSGDFRQAGPLYAALAEELKYSAAGDVSLVFRCRLQDATCRALGGDAVRALELLRGLLRDEVAEFGTDDLRPLELRRQIGLLELGADRREEAERTLRDLREDLVRLHGEGHPALARIEGALERASGL